MFLRRMIDHVRSLHWTMIAIDFVIVVVGVFIGMQVNNWNEARQEHQRAALLLNTLRVSLHDYDRTIAELSKRATDGLAAFRQARARGEQPPPYFLRTRGSDMPPNSAWQATLQSNLAELVPPRLMFDIGFFYSEQQGVGVKFVRYSKFVEREILPKLDNPSSFYDATGKLKPIYAQNMERLREWVEDNAVLVASSKCLQKRFEHPMRPGRSCRPDYSKLIRPGHAP
jgi:hypothetical protein